MSAWQPIETAPQYDTGTNPLRVLVFGIPCGVQMGRVIRYPDGECYGQADGFGGDWSITHWAPLPEPPEPTP